MRSDTHDNATTRTTSIPFAPAAGSGALSTSFTDTKPEGSLEKAARLIFFVCRLATAADSASRCSIVFRQS
ncbi:MAG TPA: hypothetical protein V6C86_02725 [Oculatellaceae cyanobacterium]